MDNSAYVKFLFQLNGGWFAGHTAFRQGAHGDGWLEKGAIIRNIALLDSVAERQAEVIRAAFGDADLIVCTGECGAMVAAAVARCLNLPLALTIFEDDHLSFHRMHVPEAGQRAILVEDLVFSGAEIRRQAEFLQRAGLELTGVSAWVNRQSDRIADLPIVSLMPAPFAHFSVGDCPLCHQGIPLSYTEIRE